VHLPPGVAAFAGASPERRAKSVNIATIEILFEELFEINDTICLLKRTAAYYGRNLRGRFPKEVSTNLYKRSGIA